MAEEKSATLTENKDAAEEPLDWKTFLEQSPPEAAQTIRTELVHYTSGAFGTAKNALQLYCERRGCEATMWFDHQGGSATGQLNEWANFILYYRCRHCQLATKHFAIRIKFLTATTVYATKIGEYPPFGPNTPARLISLIGPDRELFLKGRRSENRGLGIGAFAYYRRVVENQKNRIIEEITKVANKVGARPEVIDGLKAALVETQFSTAIDSVRPALPESLLIDGHNPLTLLHTALSRGLHEQDDAKCLELAQSVRVVLTDLAERIASVLKEETELKSAVSRILKENSKR